MIGKRIPRGRDYARLNAATRIMRQLSVSSRVRILYKLSWRIEAQLSARLHNQLCRTNRWGFE